MLKSPYFGNRTLKIQKLIFLNYNNSYQDIIKEQFYFKFNQLLGGVNMENTEYPKKNGKIMNEIK